MNPEQLDLCFPSAPAPVQADPDAELLCSYLLNNPGFHTARQLTAALDLDDRRIRRAAEISGSAIVSGPGSPGYCHFTHCPVEKIQHIADTLRSQARHMLARSIRLRNRAHATIR